LDASDRFIDAITATLEVLARHPMMGWLNCGDAKIPYPRRS
jgi:hypothetical protein